MLGSQSGIYYSDSFTVLLYSLGGHHVINNLPFCVSVLQNVDNKCFCSCSSVCDPRYNHPTSADVNRTKLMFIG